MCVWVRQMLWRHCIRQMRIFDSVITLPCWRHAAMLLGCPTLECVCVQHCCEHMPGRAACPGLQHCFSTGRTAAVCTHMLLLHLHRHMRVGALVRAAIAPRACGDRWMQARQQRRYVLVYPLDRHACMCGQVGSAGLQLRNDALEQACLLCVCEMMAGDSGFIHVRFTCDTSWAAVVACVHADMLVVWRQHTRLGHSSGCVLWTV